MLGLPRPPTRAQYWRRRIAAGLREVAIGLARRALLAAPFLLVTLALWLFAAQPFPERVELDALVSIAGIVATVLSLGLTVTLIVAQHTAERHARVLYEEFRRERSWLGVLGMLGVGVMAIVAAALARPTASTAWAALTLASALGIGAASLLPRLLDSLDRTELAKRLTDRTVNELRRIARHHPKYEREPALKPVAKRGLEIASAIADQGITTNDRETVRAGYVGMRRVIVAYVDGSDTRGWDGELLTLAFQHLSVVTDLCAQKDSVILLATAIEELRALAVESQATLEPDGPESVSIRLNVLLVEVAARTITNDQSAVPAMATGAIGEGGMALIRAKAPNGVADHIRKLRSIALLALTTGKDHVAGQAHVELSRIAVALASMQTGDIMPPSLYQDACEALGDSIDAFIHRVNSPGGYKDDWAWMWTTAPHMEHNLSRVVIAGIAADGRSNDGRRSDFADGATSLVQSLVKLSSLDRGFLTQGYAVETAYLAVLGSMALGGENSSSELIPDLWRSVARRLLDGTKERMHEVEMLESLLLVGVYEARSSRATAPHMREALEEALALTTAIEDDFHRRRRARAWRAAGRAALGCGDGPLAEAIATAIARDLRDLRRAVEGYEVRDMDGRSELFTAGQMFLPRPDVPDAHRRPETVAAFNDLLRKYENGRRRRPRPRDPKRSTQPDT